MAGCGQCKHFFITWKPDAPHGCQAYGFSTRGQPNEAVHQSTGIPCQLFKQKPPKPPPPRKR